MKYKREMAGLLRSIILIEDNVTQAASKLKMSCTQLSKVLNGKSELSIELAFKIEDVYRYKGEALLHRQLELQCLRYKEETGSLILPTIQQSELQRIT